MDLSQAKQVVFPLWKDGKVMGRRTFLQMKLSRCSVGVTYTGLGKQHCKLVTDITTISSAAGLSNFKEENMQDF